MPKVPSYDAPQVQVQGARPIQLQGLAPDSSPIAQGLGGFQRGFEVLAAKEREKVDTAAIMDADNKLTQWQQNALYAEEGGVYTKKGQGALNITNQTLEGFEQAQAEIGKSLTNDQQRARFAQIVSSRRNGLSNDLNRYEYNERQNYFGQVELGQLETSMQGAALDYQDPAKVQAYRNKVDAVLASRAQRLGLSPEAAQAEKLKTNSSMSMAVVQRMLVDSPQKAKGLYEQYKDGMTAEDQIRASNGIDQGFRRLEAEARQRQIEARQLQAIARVELQSRVQDAQAAYMQGFEFDNPPSRADFNAAYGDKGGQAYESFSKVQAVAPAIREFATATPEERQEILARFQPAQSGVAGTGFAEDDQLYRRLATVATGLMKQQQADPAAYAARYSPTVRASFATAQQDGTPEAYRAYADATIAEQQRLGVQSPKLLPDAAADQIAAAFNSQISGGENAATLIEQQQAQWGANFPLIAQQLGKKLPPEAQVIATGLPKDVAERMASVASISESELKKGLEKGVAANVATAVQSAMNPFAQSLQGQAGGVETFNTMYDAATKTALSYVRQGMAPESAAQRVVNGMVNDKYDFFDTYRVPKALDTAAVKRGADRALENISTDDLMMLPGIRGVPDDVNLEQLREAVVDGGQWVPNNDESGLSLTLNGYRLLGKDGKPITRTWDELTADGLNRPESNASRIGRVRGLGINN